MLRSLVNLAGTTRGLVHTHAALHADVRQLQLGYRGHILERATIGASLEEPVALNAYDENSERSSTTYEDYRCAPVRSPEFAFA